MLFVLAAFLSPLLYALSCVLDSYFSNSVFNKTSTFIFFASITNILVIPFLFLFGVPSLPSWETFGVIALVSAINCLYLFPYYIALKRVDTSIVVALFSLGQFSIPFLAYFIVGEQLGLTQYIGFAIILISAIALNIDFKKLKFNSAFWLLLLVSLLLCLQTVLHKFALIDVDAITVIFYQSLITTAIAWSLILLPGTRSDVIRHIPDYLRNIRFFLLNELLAQTGEAAVIVALVGLPCLTVESIGSSQSLFTLLWGALLYRIFGNKFRESLNRTDVIKKLISFACISIGIYMVLHK